MSAGQPTNFELKSATRLPTSLFIPEKKKKKKNFGTYEFQSELGNSSAESALPKVGRPCRLLKKTNFFENSANHLPSSTVYLLRQFADLNFFSEAYLMRFVAGIRTGNDSDKDARIRSYPQDLEGLRIRIKI